MSSTPDRLGGTALVAAVAVVAAWLALLGYLIYVSATATDGTWARLVVVLGSVEAIAFGAAGALFGTTIQAQRVKEAQHRAESAEGEAKEARQDASNNAEAAARGLALATAVKQRARSPRGTPIPSATERVARSELRGEVDELAALAETLFPD